MKIVQPVLALLAHASTPHHSTDSTSQAIKLNHSLSHQPPPRGQSPWQLAVVSLVCASIVDTREEHLASMATEQNANGTGSGEAGSPSENEFIRGTTNSASLTPGAGVDSATDSVGHGLGAPAPDAPAQECQPAFVRSLHSGASTFPDAAPVVDEYVVASDAEQHSQQRYDESGDHIASDAGQQDPHQLHEHHHDHHQPQSHQHDHYGNQSAHQRQHAEAHDERHDEQEFLNDTAAHQQHHLQQQQHQLEQQQQQQQQQQHDEQLHLGHGQPQEQFIDDTAIQPTLSNTPRYVIDGSGTGGNTFRGGQLPKEPTLERVPSHHQHRPHHLQTRGSNSNNASAGPSVHGDGNPVRGAYRQRATASFAELHAGVVRGEGCPGFVLSTATGRGDLPKGLRIVDPGWTAAGAGPSATTSSVASGTASNGGNAETNNWGMNEARSTMNRESGEGGQVDVSGSGGPLMVCSMRCTGSKPHKARFCTDCAKARKSHQRKEQRLLERTSRLLGNADTRARIREQLRWAPLSVVSSLVNEVETAKRQAQEATDALESARQAYDGPLTNLMGRAEKYIAQDSFAHTYYRYVCAYFVYFCMCACTYFCVVW
jgi:hypothetical protein